MKRPEENITKDEGESHGLFGGRPGSVVLQTANTKQVIVVRAQRTCLVAVVMSQRVLQASTIFVHCCEAPGAPLASSQRSINVLLFEVACAHSRRLQWGRYGISLGEVESFVLIFVLYIDGMGGE